MILLTILKWWFAAGIAVAALHHLSRLVLWHGWSEDEASMGEWDTWRASFQTREENT